MNADRDDIYSKPYEEWPGNEHVKVEIENRKMRSQNSALADKIFSIIVVGLTGFWMITLVLREIFLDDSFFVQSETFLIFCQRLSIFLIAISSACFFYVKGIKRVDLSWSLLIITWVMVVICVFFGVYSSSGTLITFAFGDRREVKMTLSESRRISFRGRGCKVNNEFYSKGENVSGSWCSPNSIPKGEYLVSVHTSSLGTLVTPLPHVEE